MVAALRHATGAEPIVTGKPDPTMHRESVLRSQARRPIVVGDRLDTDIEGANAVGCDSLLVFSGVTEPHELLAAPPALRPTYLSEDVGGLLVSHTGPEWVDGGVVCGAWRAVSTSAEGGERRLALRRVSASVAQASEARDGNDDRRDAAGDRRDLDALRALCAAVWASDLPGSERSSVRVDADADDTRSRSAVDAVIEQFGLG
jgi:hypothetical protein